MATSSAAAAHRRRATRPCPLTDRPGEQRTPCSAGPRPRPPPSTCSPRPAPASTRRPPWNHPTSATRRRTWRPCAPPPPSSPPGAARSPRPDAAPASEAPLGSAPRDHARTHRVERPVRLRSRPARPRRGGYPGRRRTRDADDLIRDVAMFSLRLVERMLVLQPVLPQPRRNGEEEGDGDGEGRKHRADTREVPDAS